MVGLNNKARNSFVTITLVVFCIVLTGGCERLVEPSPNPSIYSETGKSPLPGIAGTNYKKVETPKGGALFDQKPTIDWKKIKPLLKKVQQETGSRYVGFYSVSDSSNGIFYYATSPLSFSPEALKQAKGKVEPFLYETRRNGKNTPTQLLAAFIPNSKLAKKEMVQWLFSKMPHKPKSTVEVNRKVLASITCYKVIGIYYYSGDPDIYYLDVVQVPCDDDSGGGGGGGGTPPPSPPPPGGDPGFPGGGSPNNPGGPDVPCGEQLIPTGDCDGCNDGMPPYQVCGGGGIDPTEPIMPTDCAGVEGGTAYTDACGTCVGGTTGKLSCCATQQDIIDRLIVDEKGYVNHPNDDGGPTKYGITKKTWHLYAQELFGINPNNVSVQSIKEQQARTIYREVYWPWADAGSVSALDGDLGIFYLNMFIISPGGAVKSLQRVLVDLGYGISVDGGMGNETLDAIENAIQDGKLVELYNYYKDSMKEYWQERIEKDPENASFEDGWNNRTEEFPDKTDLNKRNVNCN